jgi:hypothetical protein
VATPRIVTRRYRGLFIAAALLFLTAIPHAALAFVYDLPPTLANLHFVTTLLVAGMGWRAEAIHRERKLRKRSRTRRRAPSPAAKTRYDAELADLDLRLRGLDGII